MLYCENCKVSITGNHEKCPLCQDDVIGEASQTNTFPIINDKRHWTSLMLRIAALVVIVASAVCIFLNSLLGGRWSIYVVAGSITGWIIIYVAVKMRGNLTKNAIWLTLIISIFSIIWDISIGYKGWSIDYVIPIICCVAMIEMFVVASIIKLSIEDYIVYLIIDILFSVVPLVFLLLGIVKVIYPSIICVAGSVISLATLIIFEGKALKAEIVRRMHL